MNNVLERNKKRLVILYNTEFIIMGLPSFSHCLCLKQQFFNLVLIDGKPLNVRTMDLLTPWLKRDEVKILYYQFSVYFLY